MAWIPKPGAVRRWRDFHKWTVPELCNRTRARGKRQASERTVRKLESKKPQRSVQDAVIRALAKALSFDEVVCHPEFLGRWQNADGSFAAPKKKLIDPTLPVAAATVAARASASAPSDDDSSEQDAGHRVMGHLRERRQNNANTVVAGPLVATEPSGLELQRALTSTAEIERAIGRHADTVVLPTGSYPLIGCDWLHELETQYADYTGKTFAIVGLVRDTRPIPARAVAVLNAENGRGATYVKIGRIASGRDPQGSSHRVDVWPTVFAPKGDHGKALLKAHREKSLVAVLAHIVIAERKVGTTRDETWEGFFWYEKGKPSPKPWAFVADEVITGEVFVEPTGLGGKRAPVLAPGGIQIE